MKREPNKELLPFISIIMPVYNDGDRVKVSIQSLLNQDYPEDKYEIIIVDNGSTDNTIKTVKNFPVVLLQEKSIRSSYAARNKGIGKAKGDILAFLDSDCSADSEWLTEGFKALNVENSDLAGGKVKFKFTPKAGISEYYDAINHIQVKEAIETRQVAYTANLFVKKYVFDKIGGFSNCLKSGGDVEFTYRATVKGFRIVFAEKAIVEHPTRTFKQILKKSFRLGYGKAGTIKNKNQKFNVIGYNAAICRLNPFRVRRKFIENNYHISVWKFWQIVLLSFLIITVNITGVAFGFFRKGKSPL